MAKAFKSNDKSVIIAAATASFLMLVFGWGFRVLAAQLEADEEKTPISPVALQQFPMQINDWAGQDIPMDEEIVRMTDTDAHIMRRYSQSGSLKFVTFYIASGVKIRDLMPHRPEVCYIGNGWTLEDKRFVKLTLNSGMKLPCNLLQFSRGSLNKEQLVVLDYYLVDGQYCHDLTLLRSKIWQGSSAVGYVAQVQITTSILPTEGAQSARMTVSEFAMESALLLADLFKNIGVKGGSNKAPSEPNNLNPENVNG